MVAPWLHRPAGILQRASSACARALEIERDFVMAELARLREVPSLLRRSRRAGGLSATDRAALAEHLRRARMLSAYLVVSVVPGAFVALPLLIWWRGRRARA